LRIAIVIPWFGRELKGGAELQAWQIAALLAARNYTVEVLTTCCRSHQEDWATNHLPAGELLEPEGFLVRRFPVDARNRAAFDAVCSGLLSIDNKELRPGVSPVSARESSIFVNELMRSAALDQYIREHKTAYDWFLLLPYLYGLIIHGVSATKDRAILQPCLHNEAYAYLPEVAQAFYDAAMLFFNSDGELRLAAHLFGPGILSRSRVVGEGVELSRQTQIPSPDQHPARNKASSLIDKPYLLYLGRKDRGKNVPLLVSAFQRFRSVRPNSHLHLVLAGLGDLSYPNIPAVFDLDGITEEHKHELLQNCLALAQPSTNESFSRVMMEAWFYGRPVAVNRSCLATAGAVEQSGGGWTAETEDEWAAFLVRLDGYSHEQLAEIGRRGQSYAAEIADWEKVIDRYEGALKPTDGQHCKVSPARAIHQVLPNLAFGDAISNSAISIRNYLRDLGFESSILVRHVDPRVAHECDVFDDGKVRPSDGIIYHHSIGTDLTAAVIKHSGPKFLIYHNITPAEFFEPFRPEFAAILRAGRSELAHLHRFFPYSAGDSTYNAEELRKSGFRDPQVLPISVDPDRWSNVPDPTIMREMQDGRTNILFVGRIAPNKRQDKLVEAFARYLQFDPTARLILPGSIEKADPFMSWLQDIVIQLGLQSSVIIPGSVSEPEMSAYYRTSDVFWSMSDHEGFGVPMVEAMWFDVPVIAKRNSAIPETLGDAALMFSAETTYPELAALIHLIVTDSGLRTKIITAQQKQRLRFLPSSVAPSLQKIVDLLS
jgi:glycosyltransferase involved in cell wall biosynthesis